MTDQHDADWRATARELGLGLRRPSWRSHISDNFGAMMRSLGPLLDATEADVRDTWMTGHRAGIPVAVSTSWPASGVKTRRRPAPTTDVVAAFDPPLLLGLRVASTSFLRLRPGPDFDVGHRELDDRFEISAFSRDCAAKLLVPHAPALLGLRADAEETMVTDNVVHVGFTGRLFDVASLGRAIDRVVSTVHAIGTARVSVVEADRALPCAAWGAFADAHGLTFDRSRMKIAGDLHGIAVELRFATALGSPYVIGRASLPRPLGLGLRIGAQTSNDGATISFDDDSADIEIGDPKFDETFVVEATDENRARAVLAAPAIRHGAMDIVRAGGDVVITDTHVAASVRDVERLPWLLERLTTLAGALGGGSGPYR